MERRSRRALLEKVSGGQDEGRKQRSSSLPHLLPQLTACPPRDSAYPSFPVTPTRQPNLRSRYSAIRPKYIWNYVLHRCTPCVKCRVRCLDGKLCFISKRLNRFRVKAPDSLSGTKRQYFNYLAVCSTMLCTSRLVNLEEHIYLCASCRRFQFLSPVCVQSEVCRNICSIPSLLPTCTRLFSALPAQWFASHRVQ